jgi:hypothetical protein
MPAVVLSAEAIALNVRLMRSSLLDELNRTTSAPCERKVARATRPLGTRFRNAPPPVIALAGQVAGRSWLHPDRRSHFSLAGTRLNWSTRLSPAIIHWLRFWRCCLRRRYALQP